VQIVIIKVFLYKKIGADCYYKGFFYIKNLYNNIFYINTLFDIKTLFYIKKTLFNVFL